MKTKQSFDFIRFCNERGVGYITEGHKHCQDGWIQVRCPFCSGSRGWHLGFNTTSNVFNCWRCGRHSFKKTLKGITNITDQEIKKILAKYSSTMSHFKREKPKKKMQVLIRREAKWPKGTGILRIMHKEYLINRGFNPNKLITDWGIRGTYTYGDYKYRIIAPIMLQGKMVSFQGRDVTNLSSLKYKACRKKDEAIHHKNIMYGMDHVPKDQKRIIVVEGIFDVWRLGKGNAVCSFGIVHRPPQLAMLYEFGFKEVFLLFDPEYQAQKQADKITATLANMGVETFIVNGPVNKDPGEYSSEEVNELLEKIY